MTRQSIHDTKTVKEVVIIDDQTLFAKGIANIINEIANVYVTATFDSGENIINKLSILKPDVLFLDLNLPGKNGLEILQNIRSIYPTMIIAILTMYEDPYLIRKVKDNKANAYLSKNASIEELQQVIFSSPTDPFYAADYDILGRNKDSELSEDPFTLKAQITQREKEIIQLIVNGKSTEEISDLLVISYQTVKTHRKNIFRKLKLNKMTELIKYAYENQLL